MSGERRSAQAELVVVKGKHRGQFVKLGAGPVTIGRSASTQLPLSDDSKVSGQHAKVVPLDGERWILEDLGSTNGTFLNDERVDQAPLRSGDLIRIGRSLIVFRADGSSVHLSDVRMAGGGSSADLRPEAPSATAAPAYPGPEAEPAPGPASPDVEVAIQEMVLASGELVFARRLERTLDALLHGTGGARALLFARHPLTGGLGAVVQRTRPDAGPAQPVLPELLRRACAGEVLSEGQHAAAPVRSQGLDLGAIYLVQGEGLALLAAAGLQAGLFLAQERTRRLAEASCEVVGLLGHQPATRPVDVSGLLSSLDRLFGPGARSRGLAWRVEVPPGLVGLADPILLGRGLDTLMEHALGVARVELLARAAVTAGGERVHLQVVRDRAEPPEVTAALLDPEGVAADLRRMGAALDDGSLAVARVALQRAGIGFTTRAEGERAIYALELPGPGEQGRLRHPTVPGVS